MAASTAPVTVKETIQVRVAIDRLTAWKRDYY